MPRILAGVLSASVVRTLPIPALAALLLLLGTGCNDYNFDDPTDYTDDDDGGPGDDDDDDTSSGSDDDMGPSDDDATDVTDDDDGDDDGEEDDDDSDPPPDLIDDCEANTGFSFQDSDGDGWLVVLSWSPTEEEGIIWVDTSGIYHLYDSYIAESGASQTNETGYLTITNSQNTDGFPGVTNCGDHWLVQDSDNNGNPPQQAIYVGTFLLLAGEDNLITLHHYCPLYRAGQCQSFHIGDPYDSGGCEDGGPNSIHMDMSGICLIPA